MIYKVRHRTIYSYEDPVAFARCVLRLTPQTSDRQTVLEHSISVRPSPSHTRPGIGAFGESTLTIVVETHHRALVIDARSRVSVHVPAAPPPEESLDWERVRSSSFETSDLGPEGPASFLYPTRRTPILADVTDYARESFAKGRPVAEAAAHLMGRIKADFAYEPGATDVNTSVATTFAERQGVCQDFAHLMIAGLRGLGLPASYVSGYLRTTPPPGRPRLEGADATHAWVRLWCGERRGWVGFDPTNAIFVGPDHIALANGRDYADVSPIDGVVLGSGDQALKVEVDVIPEDEADVSRFPTPVRPSLVRGLPHPE